MAQELTNAAKNRMLEVASDTGDYFISAHTGSPGLTGANEVTGGDYAREEATYNAASGGLKTLDSVDPIEIPEDTTITHLGVWDAVTGGNFIGQKVITQEVFGFAGQLIVSSFTLRITDPA